MTTELKQIAKQISLLNRLIELLMMQTDFSMIDWHQFIPAGMRVTDKYVCSFGGTALLDKAEYVQNDRLVQKAWSDELVRVARELNNSDLDPRTIMLLFPVLGSLDISGIQSSNLLEAILNKYGKSLS